MQRHAPGKDADSGANRSSFQDLCALRQESTISSRAETERHRNQELFRCLHDRQHAHAYGASLMLLRNIKPLLAVTIALSVVTMIVFRKLRNLVISTFLELDT